MVNCAWRGTQEYTMQQLYCREMGMRIGKRHKTEINTTHECTWLKSMAKFQHDFLIVPFWTKISSNGFAWTSHTCASHVLWCFEIILYQKATNCTYMYNGYIILMVVYVCSQIYWMGTTIISSLTPAIKGLNWRSRGSMLNSIVRKRLGCALLSFKLPSLLNGLEWCMRAQGVGTYHSKLLPHGSIRESFSVQVFTCMESFIHMENLCCLWCYVPLVWWV